MNANWQSMGYSDGSRGVHHNKLEKYRQSCMDYEIAPDGQAYQTGWEQGIRSYCTADNGYRAGKSGKAYKNICPQDIEANFLSGWEQGVQQYCTAENGLLIGLAGRQYQGVCPAETEAAFHAYYNLGHDVRKTRAAYKKIDKALTKQEKILDAESDRQAHLKHHRQHDRLLHDEERLYAEMIAVEACMGDSAYEAGYYDGESGFSRRFGEIADLCQRYGIQIKPASYRDGWHQGNRQYCTYDNGLYIGQTNQTYSGVCSGKDHKRFWRGYEEGRHAHQPDKHEAHLRAIKRKR